jgi:hypothetical protein
MLQIFVTYRTTWLAAASYEWASLFFFYFLGYTFRLRSDDPYSRIDQEVHLPFQNFNIMTILLPKYSSSSSSQIS